MIKWFKKLWIAYATNAKVWRQYHFTDSAYSEQIERSKPISLREAKDITWELGGECRIDMEELNKLL